MNIFGHHVPHKTVWIGGGLAVAAVAVIVWLRARAAANAAAQPEAAPQSDQSAYSGGGGGISVPAPTSEVADQYQQQLQNSQLRAADLANQYQQNLIAQQQKQFDFQMKQQEALAPAYQQEEASALAVQTHYNRAAADVRLACPGNAGVAADPTTGQLYCRQKTSGGILGIPVGDVFRTAQNFVGGVEAAAPSIGYQAANQAAQYYTGKVFAAAPARQAAQYPGGTQMSGGAPVGINGPVSTVHIYPEALT